MQSARALPVAPGRQKFVVDTPIPTHWRPASCEEIECTLWSVGHTTVLDLAVPKLFDLAEWIRGFCKREGLRFVEKPTSQTFVEFHFPPGQRCLQSYLPVRVQDRPHLIKLDRRELFSQQTASGVLRTFTEPEHFSECWNEEMYQVDRLLKAG